MAALLSRCFPNRERNQKGLTHMSFLKHNPELKHLTFSTKERRSAARHFSDKLIFLLFTILFYLFLLIYIKPVDGINDDWGMYSILSGAYLGYPDAHVLFFLYPLSRFLCRLYQINSSVPWFGLFQHSVHILCIFLIYCRMLQLWRKHSGSDSILLPALTILTTLFFLLDLNVISEVQYTTTAGFAVVTALFWFITTRSDNGFLTYLKENIPTLFLAWLAFCMRQNVFYMMLPIAGMIWLSKWLISNRRFYKEYFLKLFALGLLLCLGLGALYGVHTFAYSSDEWADYVRINYYRERVTDFYTWPPYEECTAELAELGIDQETYLYMQSGAPYIGYGMSVEDWAQMHRIAKDHYQKQISIPAQLKKIVTDSLQVFLYQNGMQPLNFCAALFFPVTLFLIFHRRNPVALAAFFFYLFGRTVTWGYLLYGARFPKRIIQPLIAADFMILLGILFGFNLFTLKSKKALVSLLACVTILSLFSIYSTKQDIDTSYHVHQAVWEDLKEYCRNRPDNFYIWTYGSDTLENYCESPFDTETDTYQNFFYTNWGVVCSPNSRLKLAAHGIEDFGEDLIQNPHVYFIFKKGLYHKENPTVMYLRHTYHVNAELTDTFRAGEKVYEVYQLR